MVKSAYFNLEIIPPFHSIVNISITMMVSNNSKHQIYCRFNHNNPLVVKYSPKNFKRYKIHCKNSKNFSIIRCKKRMFPQKIKMDQIITRFAVSQNKKTQETRFSMIQSGKKLFSPRKFSKILHHVVENVTRDSRDTLI